jgi:prepilin-type N-terminal cleavage/methylation domain-containing protein
MKNSYAKNGFSLVEILVATAIIVIIVSLVYGSYFAASKSTQACKSRLALFQQGRKVLGQMARQIRCSYAIPSMTLTSTPQQKKETPEDAISFFDSDQDSPSGEILHLITTSRFLKNSDLTDGLFEATYKFDKNKGTLFLSQRRFTGATENAMQKRDWQTVTSNVSCLEFAFFDGQQWLKNWNFNDEKRLPYAVKLDITCEDENHRQYRYGTIVDVYCGENQGEKTQAERLVAVKKQ